MSEGMDRVEGRLMANLSASLLAAIGVDTSSLPIRGAPTPLG